MRKILFDGKKNRLVYEKFRKEKKEKFDSWIYNSNLNNAMREFVEMQSDSNYFLIYI